MGCLPAFQRYQVLLFLTVCARGGNYTNQGDVTILDSPFSFAKAKKLSDHTARANVNRAIILPDNHVVKYCVSLFKSADFAAKVLQAALAWECIPHIHGGIIIHILMTTAAAGTNTFVCSGNEHRRSPLHKQVCPVTGNRCFFFKPKDVV